VLSFLYSVYLNKSQGESYYPDYFTHIVAKQSSTLIEWMGYTSKIENHESEASQRLFVNDEFMVRVVEGCNAASIIILFISFVIAFAEKFKKTLLFLIGGGLLIYLVNLIRIAILTVIYYEYPQYQEMLHSVVFPAIIYGMVFLLWMIWVRMLPKDEIGVETEKRK
jgi:exosortase family protein XrtF